jgi:cysteine synthase A
MNADEIEISRSTPRFRFDAPPPAGAGDKPAAKPERPPAPTPAAAAFVDEATSDSGQPVVMFALEWCEFCWSVRRMFATYGIPYRSVDLDSLEYQDDDWGGQIRTALAAKTACKTIPQIFVGGEFVGGCTEVFDAWKDGRLQALLNANEVAYSGAAGGDPYGFLPNWLHPR